MTKIKLNKMVEKIVEKVYITGGLVLLTMVIVLMSSCGTSSQMYNVGTGKPMTQSCGGSWYGGQ